MTDVAFFFDGWEPVLRIVVVGTAMYVALVLLLRVSGSRTLASMNAFDFIVTVALGAVFGRTLTARGVALAESVAALSLLVVLQYVVASLQTRSARFARAVTNPPTLLYFRGAFIPAAMRRHRVREDEVRTAVRKQRYGSMGEVDAVVLESSGDLSVIASLGDGTALGAGLHSQVPDDPARPA